MENRYLIKKNSMNEQVIYINNNSVLRLDSSLYQPLTEAIGIKLYEIVWANDFIINVLSLPFKKRKIGLTNQNINKKSLSCGPL
jgi:hypothetical protein